MKVKPVSALECTILHDSVQRIAPEDILAFLKGLCLEHGLKDEVKLSALTSEHSHEFLIGDAPVISITQNSERLPLDGMTHTLDNPLMRPFLANREEVFDSYACSTHIAIRKSAFPPELPGQVRELAPDMDIAFSESREVMMFSRMLADLALLVMSKRPSSAIFWGLSEWWLSQEAFVSLAKEKGPVALNTPAFPFAGQPGNDEVTELLIPTARHVIGKAVSIDIATPSIEPAWYLAHAAAFIEHCLQYDMLVPHGNTIGIEDDGLFRVEHRMQAAHGALERVALKLLKAPEFGFAADEDDDADVNAGDTIALAAARQERQDEAQQDKAGKGKALRPQAAAGFGKRDAASLATIRENAGGDMAVPAAAEAPAQEQPGQQDAMLAAEAAGENAEQARQQGERQPTTQPAGPSAAQPGPQSAADEIADGQTDDHADDHDDARDASTAAFDIVAEMRQQLRAERSEAGQARADAAMMQEADAQKGGNTPFAGGMAGLFGRKGSDKDASADCSRSQATALPADMHPADLSLADEALAAGSAVRPHVDVAAMQAPPMAATPAMAPPTAASPMPASPALHDDLLVAQAAQAAAAPEQKGNALRSPKKLLLLGMVPVLLLYLPMALKPGAVTEESGASGQRVAQQMAQQMEEPAAQPLAQPASTSAEEGIPSSGGTYDVRSDDAEMAAAMRQARKTLNVFWQAWQRERDTQYRKREYSLKVRFEDGNGIEHIWLLNVQRLRDGRIRGVISNKPVTVKHVRLGQRYVFGEEDISDWGYRSRKDGKLHGHFTTRVVVERASGPDMQMVRQMLAYKP